MSVRSCPCFSLRVHRVAVSSWLPVCECLLAQEMLRRLRGADDQEAAKLLAVLETVSADSQKRAALGPDMEPLSPSQCTSARYQNICQPEFRNLMTCFGLDAALTKT